MTTRVTESVINVQEDFVGCSTAYKAGNCMRKANFARHSMTILVPGGYKLNFAESDKCKTGSSETLIGRKSGKITYVHLRDRMEGGWLAMDSIQF